MEKAMPTSRPMFVTPDYARMMETFYAESHYVDPEPRPPKIVAMLQEFCDRGIAKGLRNYKNGRGSYFVVDDSNSNILFSIEGGKIYLWDEWADAKIARPILKKLAERESFSMGNAKSRFDLEDVTGFYEAIPWTNPPELSDDYLFEGVRLVSKPVKEPTVNMEFATGGYTRLRTAFGDMPF